MDVGHPEFRAVPGHVGVIPCQPGHLSTIRTQAGGGVEIIPGNQNITGCVTTVVAKRNADDGVPGGLVRAGVIFTNAKKPVVHVILESVGIAHRGFGGDGFGCASPALLIQPLIGKIGKIHDAFCGTIGPASIFMDSGSDVQGIGSQGEVGPIGVPADDGISSSLTGEAFQPEQLIAVESELSEFDRF